MSDTVFRTTGGDPTPPTPGPEPIPNERGPMDGAVAQEPLETPQDAQGAVLDALEMGVPINELPTQEQAHVEDISRYILDGLKTKGVAPTPEAINRALTEFRWDVGLDSMADPLTVIDRMGGVIEAWKQLTFIRDPHEKRAMMMKLARAQDSAAMNRIVFEEAERRAVWR